MSIFKREMCGGGVNNVTGALRPALWVNPEA